MFDKDKNYKKFRTKMLLEFSTMQFTFESLNFEETIFHIQQLNKNRAEPNNSVKINRSVSRESSNNH